MKDIDEAIMQQSQAVQLVPLDSPNLPTGLNNLGNSLLVRFEQFGEVKDVDEAVKR